MAARPSRWATVAALGACLVVGAVLLREPIGRAVFPDAALAGLLSAAEQALEAGDLDGAAQRFEAAQARAPDHPRVVAGLADTGERSLGEAAQAVALGDAARAERALARAQRLGMPGERLEALRQSLRARAEPSVEALLETATAREGLDGDVALDLYRQVLQREPGNALALAGRTRLLSLRLDRATVALDGGDAASAAALVREVRAMDPGHLRLPELEARLGAAGVIGVAPPALAPSSMPIDTADAVRWRGLADEAIGRGAFDDARRALREAERLAPHAPELALLLQRLERAEAARAAMR